MSSPEAPIILRQALHMLPRRVRIKLHVAYNTWNQGMDLWWLAS